MASAENSPPSSGMNTPTTTQIHLRGGSILTVTPPELTAWRRHVYLHGPIKLPKPTVMPRKNSVASLEAFQEAIDKVYQEALVISRRRSDEAIMDDICEWLEDFGFDDIVYEGDILVAAEKVRVDEVEEMMPTDPLDVGAGMQPERPCTPSSGPDATPVEIVVAKEVVGKTKRPSPRTTVRPPSPFSPAISPPPVETEETLRARGITRLQPHPPHYAHTESATLALPPANENIFAYTTPRPESMGGPGLEALGEVIADDGTVVDPGGFDWDDDDDDNVDEIDEVPGWVVPNKKYGRSRARSRKSTRNPVTKMRRFVATASAIL